MDEGRQKQIEAAMNFKNPVNGESMYDLIRNIAEQIVHLRTDVEAIYDHLTQGDQCEDREEHETPVVNATNNIGMGSQKAAISGKILQCLGIEDTEENRRKIGYSLRYEMRDAIKINDAIGGPFRSSISAAVIIVKMGSKSPSHVDSVMKSIMLEENMKAKLRGITKGLSARDIIEMVMVACDYETAAKCARELVFGVNS